MATAPFVGGAVAMDCEMLAKVVSVIAGCVVAMPVVKNFVLVVCSQAAF